MFANTLMLKAIKSTYNVFGSDEKTKEDLNKIEAGLGDIITLNWIIPTYNDNGYLNGFKISDNIKELFSSKEQLNSIYQNISEEESQEFMNSKESIDRNVINKNAVLITDNPLIDNRTNNNIDPLYSLLINKYKSFVNDPITNE